MRHRSDADEPPPLGVLVVAAVDGALAAGDAVAVAAGRAGADPAASDVAAAGSVAAVPPSAPPAAGVPPPAPSFEAALVLLRVLSRKSFLAHPEPLNTIAGAVSALRIDPPHTAHAAGPVPEMGWITSTFVPQASQT